MERCYICRKLIPEGQVERRVMPVAVSSGAYVGSGVGVGRSVTRAPVSLCWSCNEEADIRDAPGWGSFLFALLFGAGLIAGLGNLLVGPVTGVVTSWAVILVWSYHFYQDRKDLRRRKKVWQEKQQRSETTSLARRGTTPPTIRRVTS
jgi:hypothetical protein